MCLGIPGKIISATGNDAERIGQVSFSGITHDISLAFVPEAEPGDYVIVHVGHAISRLCPLEAERTLNLLNELEAQT